jgi:hypothetical protein
MQVRSRGSTLQEDVLDCLSHLMELLGGSSASDPFNGAPKRDKVQIRS